MIEPPHVRENLRRGATACRGSLRSSVTLPQNHWRNRVRTQPSVQRARHVPESGVHQPMARCSTLAIGPWCYRQQQMRSSASTFSSPWIQANRFGERSVSVDSPLRPIPVSLCRRGFDTGSKGFSSYERRTTVITGCSTFGRDRYASRAVRARSKLQEIRWRAGR